MGLFSAIFGRHSHKPKHDAASSEPEPTQQKAQARDRAGSTAVDRIIDEGDAPNVSTDGLITRRVCGVLIVAPMTVEDDALERCGEYVRAEIGKNEYAQRQLARRRTTLVIIPATTRMTDVAQFEGLRGHRTPDGRSWEDVRGSGGMQLRNGTFALAVPEENLVHVQTLFASYGSGYSVGMHELAHTLQDAAMTHQQRTRVSAMYHARMTLVRASGSTAGVFTDAYASEDEQEYFAQSTNCWFGKNIGEGANGRDWLARHDPEMHAFLTTLYDGRLDARGDGAIDGAARSTTIA